MGASEEDVRVWIKQSAINANEAVADYVDQYGHLVTFDARDIADSFARRLSLTGGSPVAVQGAAPRDDGDVDAYLVSQPERRMHNPGGSVDTGLTFDTTANQYGAIGEALILSHDSNPPALVYYAR